MAEPTGNPELQAIVDNYLTKSEAATDPVIDRALNETAVEAPKPSSSAAPSSTPTPAAEKHTHPPTLVSRALKAGVKQEDIDATSTEDLREELFEIYRTGAFYDPTKASASPGAPTPPPAKPALEPEAAKPVELKLDWSNDEVLDPDVRSSIDKAVTGLVKPLLDKIALLEERGGRLEQVEKHRQIQTEFGLIDTTFASLGAEFEGVFGKGAREDLDPESAEMDRRDVVVRKARQQLTPTTTPRQYQQILATVARKMFGGLVQHQAAAAEPVRTATPAVERDAETGRFTAKDFARGAVAAPTNRNGAPEPKGETRAARAIADLVRDRGGVTVNGNADLAAFPD